MERILTKESGEVLTITLNRSAAMNALDEMTFNELHQTLLEIAQRVDIKCVILQGSGGNFSGGADVKEMYAMDSSRMQAYVEKALVTMEKLSALPQITIAAVEGYAVGGGLELALACDFIVAAETACLQMPEVRLCLMPGFGGTQKLPERIGVQKAKKMILSGVKVEGKEGYSMGLVDETAPKGEAFSKALLWGEKLADNTTFECISGIKRSIGSYNPSSEGYKREKTMFFRCFETKNAQNALKKFTEQHAKI